MADLGDALRAAAPQVDELDLGAVHARRRQLERHARAGRLVAGSAVLVVALGGAVLLRGGQAQEQLVPAAPALTATVGPSTSGTPPDPLLVPPPPATGTSGTPLAPVAPPPVTAAPSPPAASMSSTPTAPPPPATAATVPPLTPQTSGTPTAPPPTSTPDFVGQTGPSQSNGTGGLKTLVAVRAAHQPGFDRVVYEFAGDGRPGWRVRYDDDPRLEGSGDPVAVSGSFSLAVVMTGISWTQPLPGAVEYAGGSLSPAATTLVREVVPGVLFEAEQQSWIGLDRQAPFRVTSLTGPARLVVDVATD